MGYENSTLPRLWERDKAFAREVWKKVDALIEKDALTNNEIARLTGVSSKSVGRRRAKNAKEKNS